MCPPLLPSARSSPPALCFLCTSFSLNPVFMFKTCTHLLFISSLFVHLPELHLLHLHPAFSLWSLPLSPFHILWLFERDSKFAIRPRNPQPRPLNHINDSFLNQHCNYTGERLLDNTVVQLRGEPTTTANLSQGECSSVRGWGRGGVACLCICVCVCV